MVRCASDEHYYDETKHTICPYCSSVSFEDKTRVIEEKTRVMEPPKQRNEKTEFVWVNKNDDHVNELVVGWLVVLSGSEKGKDFTIIPGMNSVGRDQSNTITLSFDATITAHKHAVVVYDYKNKQYFLNHGEGVNLTYLNDEVVLQPTVLQTGDVITLGNTDLKFVAFEHDWKL
jgi:hypothetical protein